MNKIPCIKCTPELWEYIKPHLIEWGYRTTAIGKDFNSTFCILTLNWNKNISLYGFGNDFIIRDIGSELTDNVEEFLERAAKLKDRYYRRKDSTMTFNGIEIKPGMVITTNQNVFYIVFPTEKGIAFCNLDFGGWRENIPEHIKRIQDLSDGDDITSGKILWEKPKEIIITMDEIADKFGYPVEQIKIAK